MVNASPNDVTLVAQPLGRQAQVVAKVRQVCTAEIPQLHPLQVVPDPLVRIQIRRVPGQRFQVEALGTTAGQEVFDRLAAMDRRAIPDHQQLAGNMAQQMAQEAHHILAAQGPLLDQEQELAIRGNTTDGREVIFGQGNPQDGRLAAGRIAPHPTGQQIEARFVYPDDGAVFGFGLFLSAGQRSVSQAAMAASSRWVARSVGCWGLQPMARRSRGIWAG
jgi:hypothetical protein